MQNPSFVMNQLLIFICVPNPAEPQCLRRLEQFSFCQNVYSRKKHLGNRNLQSQHIPCSEIPEACGDFSCGSQLRAACPVLPWQGWIPRCHAVRALGTFPSAFLAQGKPMCVGVFTALRQGAVSSVGCTLYFVCSLLLSQTLAQSLDQIINIISLINWLLYSRFWKEPR